MHIQLSHVIVLVSVVYLGSCATTVETPVEPKIDVIPDKSLSDVTDTEWEACQERAENSIKRGGGPGLGDTGERAAYTYGGILGSLIALGSAKSRHDEGATAEQQEKRYYTYWNTMKECLRSKGYIVPDDSDEVERP